MTFLKSREGGRREHQSNNHRRNRRKSSVDLYDPCESDEPQFSCLDENKNAPCSPQILIPPSELMTRPLAFRHAYWRHQLKPTAREVPKLDLRQMNERKERMAEKRRMILAKVKAYEKKKREKGIENDLRRRAERVLNRNSGMDSGDESGDESESDREDIVGLGLGNMSLLGSPSSQTSAVGDSSVAPQGRSRRMMRSTIVARRNLLGGGGGNPGQSHTNAAQKDRSSAEEDPVDDDAFSFLSEWGKSPGSASKRW